MANPTNETLSPLTVAPGTGDRLRALAEALGYSSVADLRRAALAAFVQANGYEITVADITPGQWGGRRPYGDNDSE